MSDHLNTSHTLLQRTQDTNDEEAWNRFVSQYGRFIIYILRELGVAEDDLQDLTQQVLIGLTKNLGRYDRTRASFRNWLGTVIRNAAISHFRKLQRRPSSDCELKDVGVADGVSCSAEINTWIEQEWTTYIATQAMERVRQAFQGQAVEAFELGIEGHTAAEISEQTGLSVASVYTLRKRVKQRLYLEARALSEELES